MKRQILIDALGLTDERPKGVQICILNLLKQFSVIDTDFEFTVLIRANKTDSQLPKANQVHYWRIKARYPVLWRLLELPGYLKGRNFDLLHSMFGGPVLNNIPLPYIITINESRKKYYKFSDNKIGILNLKARFARLVQLGLQQKMIDQADIVIAISNNTKRDLIAEYGPAEEKIKVVYNAVDRAFFCEEKQTQPEDETHNVPYILIFATGDNRENVSCALRAFVRIKDKINYRLSIVGIPEGRFEKELTNRCRKLGILDRTNFFNFVSSGKLVSIYKNAGLYIDMSFFEGFGLQVLEAMAAGVPVITSDVDSLPEVVGDAGILLNPDDDIALADAILSVLGDNQKRQRMQAASRMQAEKFSWRRSAEEILKVYDEVICQRSR